MIEIYKRLSTAGALLPPALGYVFDRELRSATERQDLERTSDGAVSFLARRTFENYLLNPAAIATVLTNALQSNPPVNPTVVDGWLNANWATPKFCPPANAQTPLVDTHAPRLLAALFQHVSGDTVEYSKVKHSVALTDWIIENAPAELSDLKALLDAKLGTART